MTLTTPRRIFTNSFTESWIPFCYKLLFHLSSWEESTWGKVKGGRFLSFTYVCATKGGKGKHLRERKEAHAWPYKGERALENDLCAFLLTRSSLEKKVEKRPQMDVDKILSYSNDPKTDFYAILNCPPTATVSKSQVLFVISACLEGANHRWIPRTFPWTASWPLESKRQRLSRALWQISTRARGEMRADRR